MSSKDIFILRDVIDDLMDINKSLSSPLMKLNFFAERIKNQELLEFTTLELEGYKLGDDLVPDYRRSISKIEVTFKANIHTHTREIPFNVLEKPYNEKLKYFEIGYGIGTLEQMITDRNKKENPDPYIFTPLPMQMLHVLQTATERIYNTDAYITVESGRVKGNAYKINEIVSIVRRRLLSFAMAIAEEFGYEIEISSFKMDQEKNNNVINNFMETNITVTGHGNAVNTGNNSSLSTTVTISQEDQRRLQELGVEDSKINELNKILESNSHEKSKLKESLKKWLGEVSAHLTAIQLGHNLPAITEFIGKFF